MSNYYEDDFFGSSGDGNDDIDKLMEELLGDIDLSEDAPEEEILETPAPTEEMYFETEDEEEEPQSQPKRKALQILLIVLCVILGIALVVFGASMGIKMLSGDKGVEILQTQEEVPFLVGMDYSNLPEEMKVTVVKAGEAYDDLLPAGQILSQEPAAGTQVEPGTEVAVVVSLGKEPVKVTLPETLAGMTQEEAQQWIQSQEITLNVTTETVFADGAAGIVLKTTPEAGAVLAEGDTVLLTVSKGDTAQVPQVTGKTEAEALEALKAAGFENVKTVKVTAAEPEGTVVTQSMGAGQTMKVANLIVLRVAGTPAEKPEAQKADAEPEATKPAAAPQETEPEETEAETEATEETEAAETTEATETTDATEATEATEEDA